MTATSDSPAPGALLIALSTALRFDRKAVDLRGAARAAIGIVAALSLGLWLVGDAGAASAAVGALLAGMPSISATRRRPLATMAATTAGLVASTFVGSATAHEALVHLVILTGWAFFGGLLIALGDTGALVGTQATMAFIVFGRFAEPIGTADKLAAYVAAGGVLQMLLVAATRWPIALAAQRNLIADAYDSLQRLAGGGPDHPTIGAGSSLDAAEASLISPTLIRRADVGVLRSLVDEGRRMRIELGGLQALRAQLERRRDGDATELAALDRVLEAASALFGAIAAVLLTRVPYTGAAALSALGEAESAFDTGRKDFATAFSDHVADPGDVAVARAIIDHVDALSGQLRASATLARESLYHAPAPSTRHTRRLAASASDRLRTELAMVRANLTPRSTAFRHAVRLAIVVLVAELLAAHTPLQRGYWVALTAAIVLRPDFATTMSRGFARLLGTVLGVGLTGVIVAGGHLGGVPAVVTIGVLAFLGFSAFRASYAVFSALLTGLVVLLINLATPAAHSSLATAGDRLLDTVIGGALALVAYSLWPTWAADEALGAVVATVAGERAYLAAVFTALCRGGTPPEAELRGLARHLRLTRTNAEAVVARSLAEPHARRINDALASGLLAGLRRLSLTTHVLRTQLLTSDRHVAIPELEPLAAALGEALQQIHDDLQGGAPRAFPPLRRLHDELEDRISGRPAADLLLVESDEIVDVIDTLADLVGAWAGDG
jgi:uncharacterized membrane protein YccC